MLNIKKKYVTNEDNQPVAVQVDIDTFNKMEELLEDYALGKMIEETQKDEAVSVNEAKAYYNKLRKE